MKVNVVIHPDSIQMRSFLNFFSGISVLIISRRFDWNQWSLSREISEVCHVIVHYNVTRRETETRAPFPYLVLYPPPSPIAISFFIWDLDSFRVQHVSRVLQMAINCWILSRIGVRPLMLFQPGSDGLKSLSHIGFGVVFSSTGNTICKVGTLLKRLFVFNLDQLLS